MTDATADNTPEDDNVLAAEYVLGVLDAAPRRAATERIEREPDFAANVKAWEGRLESFNASYAPVTPPPGLKAKLMTRLFPNADRKPQGAWQALKFWRGFAAGALAAGLIAFAMSSIDRQPALTADPLVASLQADTGSVRFVVLYQPGTDEVHISKLDAEKTPQQNYELWLIEADGTPQSLGVLSDKDRNALTLSGEFVRKINAGDTFAISIEPAGGSPTGEVTGPVIAAGVCNLI